MMKVRGADMENYIIIIYASQQTGQIVSYSCISYLAGLNPIHGMPELWWCSNQYSTLFWHHSDALIMNINISLLIMNINITFCLACLVHTRQWPYRSKVLCCRPMGERPDSYSSFYCVIRVSSSL